MNTVLNALRATAEPTRLRLLALCAESELTVTELTGILGQSQPRVSRHLKVLCDAGMLDRFREGSWVFFRLARDGEGAELGRFLVRHLPGDDAVMALDRRRLEEVRHARAEVAAAYFRDHAADWDDIRAFSVPEAEVEDALLGLFASDAVGDLLDVGTGTGRVLEVFADRVGHAVGIDLSREMLAVARANLEGAGRRNCEVRHGDMYKLPLPSESFDAVVFHQVLHFADRPGAALAEASRVLRRGGRLAVADFAPHDLERLREQHAHRRLGFTDDEVAEWCRAAGLAPGQPIHLAGDPLTVTLWSAVKYGEPATREGRL
ncbi:MAG: ArsR/SmtB family transcription factor [Alphaproteobacteria bacterium]